MSKVLCLLALCVASALAVQRGPVQGVSDCGSAGELLEVRVTDCDDSPCHLEPGTIYEIEVDFVASANSVLLNWRILVTLGVGGIPIADLPIDGNISEGGTYRLKHSLLISDDLSGLTVRIKFEITDVSTNRMEVCALADAHIG